MCATEASILLNGIDGATGAYRSPRLRPRDLASWALRGGRPGLLGELQRWLRRRKVGHLALADGFDSEDLASAGWGVIFAEGADPAIREALSPLLERRQAQAGERYAEFAGAAGLHSGGASGRTERKTDFLRRHGVGPGPVVPGRVPYYLLLVGNPREIPWSFHLELGFQYAVGRLDLDSPAAYSRYASSVLETAGVVPSGRPAAAFFSPRTDRVTELLGGLLVESLYRSASQDRHSDDVRLVRGEAASKDGLAALLRVPGRRLVFTGSHGIAFPLEDPRQEHWQGALACGEWSPTREGSPPGLSTYAFGGEDLASDTDLSGQILFCFACESAGSPRFASDHPEKRRQVAARPFVAHLPRCLLGKGSRGALAFIGHVGRAWGYSFLWRGVGAHTAAFEQVQARLLEGRRVGACLEPLKLRYAELLGDLSVEQKEFQLSDGENAELLAELWTATEDARNYVLLGDPAVHL